MLWTIENIKRLNYMAQYIDKSALVTGIEKLISIGKLKCQQSQENNDQESYITWSKHIATYKKILSLINTLEVKDPYKQQYIQYDFIIKSELFHQLTKEQQKLWRKEIEQAVISGGEAGIELAKDQRYKENLEAKEADMDLEKELIKWHKEHFKKDGTFIGMSGFYLTNNSQMDIAKHFFELGLQAQKGE